MTMSLYGPGHSVKFQLKLWQSVRLLKNLETEATHHNGTLESEY